MSPDVARACSDDSCSDESLASGRSSRESSRRVKRHPALLALSVAALALTSASTAGAVAVAASACPGRGDVTFRAADGTRLVGRQFGRGTAAVVLAHQARGDLCQWVTYGRRLAAQLTSLAFDFRGHGRSQQVGYRRAGVSPET
jgi:hypothetical protein